jgi:hypothetical protein
MKHTRVQGALYARDLGTLRKALPLFALARKPSRSLIGLAPIPMLLGLIYLLDKLSEAVRNCPRTNLVVLSEPAPDFGADPLLFP